MGGGRGGGGWAVDLGGEMFKIPIIIIITIIIIIFRNLAYNNLRTWRGTLSTNLPNLQLLNITGNYNFKLNANKKLLTDTALKTILGATLTTKGCVRCNFSRTDAPWEVLMKPKRCQFIPLYNMPLIDQFQKKFLYFNGTCAEKSCALKFVPMHKVRRTYKNYCRGKAKSLGPVEYFLGAVAMVFNFVVIVTILCSRFLIKKTSLFLTAQLAFGDLLLAVYSLTIANNLGFSSHSNLRQWREHQCLYSRSLLILGQTIEALTSALMALERYLVIVHCMRPSRRITFRMACFLCGLSCIFGALSCFAIEHFDNPLIRGNYMCVLLRNLRRTNRLLASQVLMLLFVAIYLAVVGMYIHIYIFVKRSAQRVGVQRETKLAKRISIIVLSNMFFYAAPNLVSVVLTAGNYKLLSDPADNLILRIWLPPMCMVTNACLNPFLFAFRNEEFLKALKNVVRRIFPRAFQVKNLPTIPLANRRNRVGPVPVINVGENGQTPSH